MKPDTRIRSKATEAMDDFDLHTEELRRSLDKIAQINRLLGGNAVTLSAVENLVARMNPGQPVRITDLGCGNGDMLRVLSRRAKLMNRDLLLTGIDANAFTVDHAISLSQAYANIQYACMNILDETFAPEPCDIVLCTLTLHHFQEEEIICLLVRIFESGARAIVINDLHRSRAAYLLFVLVSRLLRLTEMNTEDGKLSILKGFKRKELQELATQLQLKKHRIRWRWAFRYQWVISNI